MYNFHVFDWFLNIFNEDYYENYYTNECIFCGKECPSNLSDDGKQICFSCKNKEIIFNY